MADAPGSRLWWAATGVVIAAEALGVAGLLATIFPAMTVDAGPKWTGSLLGRKFGVQHTLIVPIRGL